MSTLNATDLFVVRRGSQTYKVSYHDVLAGVVLPSVLTYMGATNPAAAAPAPAGGLKAGMTYVLAPSGKLAVSWTGIAGINATDGQLAIWEGAKWELIGNTGAIPHATEAVSGIVELATAAETTTGTDNTRAVHPAGLKVELDKKAPLASPTLTGTPTAPTAAAGTNTTQLATTAFVHAATPNASTTVHGVVQLADAAAVTAGTAGRVVDAAQLKAVSDADDWTRTGTTIAPRVAGDVVTVSAGTAALPGLTPVGDPNTGLWAPAADTLALSVKGGEALRVDDQKRVGIGASAPGAVLHSVGTGTGFPATSGATQTYCSLRLGGSDSTGVVDFGISGHANWIQSTDHTDLSQNYSLLLNPNGGSVGIGTTNPAELLELSATTDPKIRFVDVGNVDGKIGISSSAALTFEFKGAERARIDSSGRLLIDTSSDSGGAMLQVNGDRIRVGTAKTPASASDTGTTGEIAWDANYIYVCTATNTWKRSAIATW